MEVSTYARSAGFVAAGGSAHPTIKLGDLLHEYQLELVLIAGATEDVSERLVQWVHVSELEDPAPFLTPRTALLTTGARFAAMRGQAAADAYVQRLIDSGTSALGVAVGLHSDRIPARFVTACDALGLPLFRVPYDTSFIAIVQTAARLLDAQLRERDLWSLDAQRAVARASLHRSGLGSAVRETATRLGRWVGITDRSGRLTEFAPSSARADVSPDWIRRESRRLIERRVNAGRVEDANGTGLHMQVLGREGTALGVLVVEDRGNQDSAERSLLGLVAALATVQLEHRSGLDAASSTLRAAIVDLLIAGDHELAERLSVGVFERLPQDPVVVIRLDSDSVNNLEFAEDLHSLDAGSSGLIRAELKRSDRQETGPLILAESRHAASVRRLLQSHHVSAGVSPAGPSSNLQELLTQAERALEFALERLVDGPVVYEPAIHDGVIQLLHDDPEAQRRSESLLSPILHHDKRHDDNLEACLRVWLSHHGQTSPAASELGLHRHTLKTKVQTAATLLQCDIDSPDTRADLWTALRLTG